MWHIWYKDQAAHPAITWWWWKGHGHHSALEQGWPRNQRGRQMWHPRQAFLQRGEWWRWAGATFSPGWALLFLSELPLPKCRTIRGLCPWATDASTDSCMETRKRELGRARVEVSQRWQWTRFCLGPLSYLKTWALDEDLQPGRGYGLIPPDLTIGGAGKWH